MARKKSVLHERAERLSSQVGQWWSVYWVRVTQPLWHGHDLLGHHGPEPMSEQLPDMINTFVAPIPPVVYPSCDWTKNNKDNDARNNDERLEQRNWAPGAGPGWVRDITQDGYGALAPISRPGLWPGHYWRLEWWQSTDTHLHTPLSSTLGEELKINTFIIFHFSDHQERIPPITIAPKTINSR